MATTVALDDALIAAAVRLGRHRTKKAAVTAALEEYVRGRKQQQVRRLFGAIDYRADYDYKEARRRR